MILVDRQIEDRVHSCTLIEHFESKNLQSMLYDLTVEKFIETSNGENKEFTSHTLLPMESVIVATREIIHMPKDLIAHIVGKNSRIRQGLMIESPVYQPCHATRVYFRITNLSNVSIILYSGKSYASIMFELLDGTPDNVYGGTFQDELNYDYLGNYAAEYSKELKAVEEKIDEFKEMEKSVYSNVITILTVFIAIFSIINVNVSLASGANLDWTHFVLFNLCTIGSISLLANYIIRHLSPKTFANRFWVIPLLCFAIAFLILFM